MSGLFGGKSREEREAEKQELQRNQREAADRYEAMVTKSLEQLTRWAFPDSQIERSGDAEWKLWHTADNGEKYVDATVLMEFDAAEPQYFTCDSLENHSTDDLAREALNDALRMAVCGS